MNSVTEIAPVLQVRGMRPPIALDQIKLLVFGMDSALLYPGAQELADACSNAGIGVNMTIGEATDGLEKQRLLLEACLNLNIEPRFVMVVGRATSDLPMMAIAGISIAFMASSDVAAAATLIVGSGSLDRVLSALVLPATKGAKDLDLSVLETLVNHDPVKFKKFALLFIDSIETVLLEIDSGIATLDMPKLMGMGHRAKSTAKNIGAEGFSSQCLLLEQTARTGDLTAAIKIAQGLRPQFNTIREAILRRLTLSA